MKKRVKRSPGSVRARSNKAKGRNGQKEVQQLLLEYFPDMELDDCRSNPMGAPGEDILLSPAFRKKFPYQIEVKRSKSMTAMRWVEQAREHSTKYNPVVFFREDGSKEWFILVSADHFLTMIRNLENINVK